MKKRLRILTILATLAFPALGCDLQALVGYTDGEAAVATGTSDAAIDPVSTNGGSSGGGGGGSQAPSLPPYFGRIFLSTTHVQGAAAAATDGSGPAYSMLDAICQSDANALNIDYWGRGTVSGTQRVYRALVAFDSVTQPRAACNSPDCVTSGNTEHVGKWPLNPSTEYRRADGVTRIGTTNVRGTFTFPLENAISSSADIVWTGIFPDWTTAPSYYLVMDYNCFGSISVGAGYGEFGRASSVDSQAIGSGNPQAAPMGEGQCSHSYPMYCAEVKPTVLPTQESYRKIFVTTSSYGFGIGKAALDSACQTEANSRGLGYSGHAPYKALVQSPARRLALYALGNFVGGPIDWVMDANREYRREDGTTVIGTTNSSAVLDFPLTNSITGAADSYWTGFGRTDLFYGGNPAHPFAVDNVLADAAQETCSDFSTSNSGFGGRVGTGSAVSASAFGNGVAGCDSTQKLLCVEQTRSNVFYD